MSGVLVVESDATVRAWLEAGLRARGHEVVSCSGPAEAWEAFLFRRPSLLVVDWSDLGGAELCRRVRDAPGGDRCIVLAAGLSDRPQVLEAALEAGADDILPKLADAGVLASRLAVAERRVRRAEEHERAEGQLCRLRKAVDVVPVCVTVTDLEGTILHVNPAEAEMHGYRVDELMGRDVAVLSHRERGGSVPALRAGLWQRERRQRHRDGHELRVRLVSDVACDPQGEPLGFVTVCLELNDARVRLPAESAGWEALVLANEEARRPE